MANFSVPVLVSLSFLFLVISFLPSAHAEDVVFIVPGSSNPASEMSFDPQLQVIAKDQTVFFVNPDNVDHHLVIKDAEGQDVFDTGVLGNNEFASHTFSENGEYSLQCKIYPHMRGQIKVTDDIATFTQRIPEQNIDVQLSMSPAYPGPEQDTYVKLVFVDATTGRNHPHIDYTLDFEDSDGNRVDGMGGHTVDGADYKSFSFGEGAFTPKVTVTGVNFVFINPATVQFDTVVTPEFPAIGIGVVMAFALAAITLYMRKRARTLPF